MELIAKESLIPFIIARNDTFDKTKRYAGKNEKITSTF